MRMEDDMQIREIMTADPMCCAPDTSLREVARLMAECDCGEIPVADSWETMRPVGVVTDRDITVRAVAKGRNPLELTAGECMTTPAVTIRPDTTVEECCAIMERHQVRRVPVVDQSGKCCGMVSQADIAKH